MSDDVGERELTQEELADAGRYALVIEWSPEDDAFIASVPDIPGIHTHGTTRAQAAEAGDQVLALWLSARKKSGQSVPRATFVARYATHPLPSATDGERVRWLRRRLDVSQ